MLLHSRRQKTRFLKCLIPLFIGSLLLCVFTYEVQSTTNHKNDSIQMENGSVDLNSSILSLHSMSNDPEVEDCYSLKSLIMPEEIIDLNAVNPSYKSIHPSQAPKVVTFNQVHSILYGDPSKKFIYNYTRKYFQKDFDSSYPHTFLQTDLFFAVIRKLHRSLKVQFVVEVGSFTGNSALRMGSILKQSYPGSFLLCIDTWLGG